MSNRAKILKIVSLSPGIHLRELQRCIGSSFNSVRYNVDRLTWSGEIVCEKGKGFSRLYPLGTSERERIVYSLIQNKTTRRILVELASGSLYTNKELSEISGFAKSTISEQIHRLLALNVVRLTLAGEGNFKVELQDPQQITSLLEKSSASQKTSDIVDSFTELWDF